VEIPEVSGVSHRFVDVRGIRLHVAEAGPASCEPVLLLHGFPQHWYAWRHVMPLLAADHRVIALDLRGFGWSDAPKRGYTGPDLAADVVALLDELSLERVRIIGHDWGAWIGFIVALTAPERVDRLVAVNMTHPWPSRRHLLPNLWRMWHTALLEYPPIGRTVLRRWPGFVRFLLRHWAGSAGMWDRAGLDVYAEVSREPARARAGEQFHWRYVLTEILAHPRGRFRAARLTVPTLILGGADDVVLPPSVLGGGERHADELRVVVVPDCGHLMPEEWPEVVADEASAFFAESREVTVGAGRRARPRR
jgi:pimeloyl-ACP methyl ester carboxylesterase